MIDTLTIRDETVGDETVVHDVIGAAFMGHPHSRGAEPFIMEGLRKAGAATVALVAEERGAIVGQIAFSPVTIDGRPSNWHGAGPVSVRPDRQGRRIGTRLVEAGLERLRALRSDGCVLVGDAEFYGRFGFRPSADLSLPNVPPEFFLVLPFTEPVPTGTVAFHEAFDTPPRPCQPANQ